ncbi:hypothetical protein WY02_24815 [Pseudonocardia sp. AL041005-10]|nr:hypothetical protein WY02_24815 [Pseudonocardia sp. AL041005-10]
MVGERVEQGQVAAPVRASHGLHDPCRPADRGHDVAAQHPRRHHGPGRDGGVQRIELGGGELAGEQVRGAGRVVGHVRGGDAGGPGGQAGRPRVGGPGVAAQLPSDGSTPCRATVAKGIDTIRAASPITATEAPIRRSPPSAVVTSSIRRPSGSGPPGTGAAWRSSHRTVPEAAGVATANQGPMVATSARTSATRPSVTRPGEAGGGPGVATRIGGTFTGEQSARPGDALRNGPGAPGDPMQ